MRRAAMALFIVGSAVSRLAQSEPNSELERAKESFKAGATAYAAGDYLAAIQALNAAYRLTPLPAIAFSIGQAERRQYFVDHARSHLDRAIVLFRHYIEVAPSGSRRADALDALSQLEPLGSALPPPSSVQNRAADRAEHTERRTRVLVSTDAPNAQITLDGAPALASPLIREVEPGKHHVRVEAAGFFPAEREVMALSGELMPTQVPLRERPSTLSISAPAAAELYVDGTFVSAGGEAITIQLPSGTHHLAVARTGYGIASQELALERGRARSIRVSLEPTSQRIVSEAMFIAGGAALGASLVFSSLAIRAEGRAEDFLGRRARGNVSSAELTRYDDTTIVDRDRYRLATSACLVASAGFFITGLFLHELDRPNPQQLYRSLPRSDTGPTTLADAAKRAQLELAPLVSSSGIGALVGGAF